MNNIEHRTIFTNGINMHVASIGAATAGPAILFLHGFPEFWYSWRHQLRFFSNLGYRVFAPDLRGYGDSDSPIFFASYTIFHIVGDLLGLLDYFTIDRVFLVGHDWGAAIAWAFALFRPERIKALVALSVPFTPRDPARNSVEFLRDQFGNDFYVCRFQEPDMVEEFRSMDPADIFKIIFSIHDPRPPMIPRDTGLVGFPVPDTLPTWLTEEDLSHYATKFANNGFYGGLNYYRVLKLNWELTAPWTRSMVRVPAKFMIGKMDPTYHIPGVIEYIQKGGFKRDVPLLDTVVEIEGAAHFLNQERPHQINQHIHDFIKRF
ncbi:uncharacterized protein LOC111487949 [Cucurbita maxima]|uniref:soluble epoxide hydrolase n=1 Tax=Cucurbita maxima TaxID=3661 RepID=A0A6J1JU94_CUCMA|nr:uncharacterized protein LOC111487949 [Cucurbita maxima]